MRPGKAIVYMFDGAELTYHLIARGARARDGEVFWLSFDTGSTRNGVQHVPADRGPRLAHHYYNMSL
jgi:hypothetical protein